MFCLYSPVVFDNSLVDLDKNVTQF